MIEEEATLKVDDLLGVWNLVYSGGQTGTFTISRKSDGSLKIDVRTAQGGDNEAEDILLERDTVSFARDVNFGGTPMRASYTLKLVEGEFAGTTKFGWQNTGVAFTATRAE